MRFYRVLEALLSLEKRSRYGRLAIGSSVAVTWDYLVIGRWGVAGVV